MKKQKTQKNNKGITLIALVITIIVMLILVAVTISMAVNGGLFEYARSAGTKTNEAVDAEQELASGKIEIDGKWYQNIDDYLNNKPTFNAEKWDENAAKEDAFIWQSDDQNDEGYGVVVGYTSNIQTYSTLKFPSRCTKITVDDSYITGTWTEMSQMRSYTKNIKEVELPNTVVELGYKAFYNYGVTGYHFDALQKITIPDSVTSIGDYAFQYSKITDITIPDSVTSIGAGAFSYCENLTNITIPSSVTSIRDSVFSGCSGLSSIIIPDNVKTMGPRAFQECTNLKNIKLSNGMTKIDDQFFSRCTSLKEVVIPESCVEIGDNAFEYCTSLEKVTIPEGVTTVRFWAFYGCTSLADVKIPSTVTSIYNDAFYNVPHIEYHGTAEGAPWGASSMN